MSAVCTSAKELADAMKRNEDEIIVEGDLKKDVLRIKSTGKVAWGVCAVALTAAIAFYIATPAATVTATPVGRGTAFVGGAAFVSGAAMTAAASVTLGSAAVPAVMIGVCAGGIGALNHLRDKYKIVEKDQNRIRLKRKE